MLPRALKGTILALLGAALAPAFAIWLIGSISFLASDPSLALERILSGWKSGWFVLVAISFVAGLHAVVLGLPAFLILQGFNRANWVTAIAGGFLIGALPVSVLTSPYSSVGQWRDLASSALYFGACGLCSGAAFWFMWTRFGAQPSSSD